MPRLPKSPASLRREREYEQRVQILAMTECLWPLCSQPPTPGPEPLPLCTLHAVKVWGVMDAVKDRKPLTEHRLNRRIEAMRQQDDERDERESRSIAPGWVYYVRVTDRIKIGYSTDVKRRMRAYPPHAELLAVHPGTPTLEREMHARFAGHLAQGREWFRPDPEVMTHIDDVVTQFGPPPKHMVYKFREGTTQRIKPRARR